jgi:KDO2-lipid IV(A) lauroyltransferase
MPVFLFRRDGSHRHEIRCFPALALEPAGSDAEGALRENVCRMVGAIEEAIRAAPDQWAWSHRRWRTQPPGEPRPYPSRGRRRALRVPLAPRVEVAGPSQAPPRAGGAAAEN